MFLQHIFINLFNKYLLINYYMLSVALGLGTQWWTAQLI